MKITLNRFLQNKYQTLGILSVLDDNNKLIYKCNTLELPWRNNEKQVSCIPVGEYKVIKRNSQKYGKHFLILNVPSRQMILIHFGNFTYDTQGCIIVGQSFSDIDGDGLRDVLNSKKTLNDLNKILPNEFTLVIKNQNVLL